MDLFKNDSDSSSDSSLEFDTPQDVTLDANGNPDQSMMSGTKAKKTHAADFNLLP